MGYATRRRAEDIKLRIGYIRELLAGKQMDDLRTDLVVRAAFERFLEIISEASRHLPDDLKALHGGEVPWRHVADLGNVLRHVYHRAALEPLWDIYTQDLDSLEVAIDEMLEELPAPTPPAPSRS